MHFCQYQCFFKATLEELSLEILNLIFGNEKCNSIISIIWNRVIKNWFFQDDHRGFRRQLEDKRPVVENNLLSGRQYIANEPPLSDTSDSEGEGK